MRRIDQIHLEHPFMGSCQIARVLRRQSRDVDQLHGRTLMRKMGLPAQASQSGTSQRRPGHKKIFSDLLRMLAIVRSNPVRALDMTPIQGAALRA